MSEELEVRIKSWLNKQGFPLEMEVASIARNAGFDVSQSECYLDPETSTAREIDLVLSKGGFCDLDEVGYINYTLFVECKSSKDKPWLLFSTPSPEVPEDEFEAKLHDALNCQSSALATAHGFDLLTESIFNEKGCHLYPMLGTEKWLGYGITQAFAEAQDTPFKAIISATKAAHAYQKEQKENGWGVDFSLIFPVVVIDVPLYAVFYSSESNQISTAQIDVGTMLWKHMLNGKSEHAVYIVTKQALPEFLKRCHTCAKWLLTQEDEFLQAVIDKHID